MCVCAFLRMVRGGALSVCSGLGTHNPARLLGTLADFTTILLHLMPLSAALVVLAKSFRIMYIRFD